MIFTFNEVKNFLRLRDPSIGIEPHYSKGATIESIGVRLSSNGVFKMVGIRSTVEETVDSILAEVSELRGRSA